MTAACQAELRGALRERDLPQCVRDALEAARRSRPERDVTCLAFRTLARGREVARMGWDAALGRFPWTGSILRQLRAKDLLVVSVTVTETTFETVDTVTHVLVTLTTRREPDC